MTRTRTGGAMPLWLVCTGLVAQVFMHPPAWGQGAAPPPPTGRVEQDSRPPPQAMPRDRIRIDA
ncbi:MAG: hypothetical protein Q8M96_18895, partial [Rubrivivax sp.]|nr:hypothetical protein [Rubrivivax sp.]